MTSSNFICAYIKVAPASAHFTVGNFNLNTFTYFEQPAMKSSFHFHSKLTIVNKKTRKNKARGDK